MRKEDKTHVQRIDSDKSTRSSDQDDDDKRQCRHIETLFARDAIPNAVHGEDLKSVHGDNYFLPAHIIYEGRTGCANKPVREWSLPRTETS